MYAPNSCKIMIRLDDIKCLSQYFWTYKFLIPKVISIYPLNSINCG